MIPAPRLRARKAIFVCASIFASILAYESERSSRARFRSKEKALATHPFAMRPRPQVAR